MLCTCRCLRVFYQTWVYRITGIVKYPTNKLSKAAYSALCSILPTPLFGGVSMTIRREVDTFGPIDVPSEHLWGAQTQRSLHFFDISTEKMPTPLVDALARLKRATAQANAQLGQLEGNIADSIVQAADE